MHQIRITCFEKGDPPEDDSPKMAEVVKASRIKESKSAIQVKKKIPEDAIVISLNSDSDSDDEPLRKARYNAAKSKQRIPAGSNNEEILQLSRDIKEKLLTPDPPTKNEAAGADEPVLPLPPIAARGVSNTAAANSVTGIKRKSGWRVGEIERGRQ